MDPILAKTAVSLAGSLGRALGKPIGRRVHDRVLGAPEDKALRKACDIAVRCLAEEIEAEDDLSADELTHALALMERLVEARRPDGLPLLAVEPAEMPTELHLWREKAEEAGLDPVTFPAGFDRMVESLLSGIAREVGQAARRADNPLFNQMVLDNLERLKTEVVALSQMTGNDGLARLVPLAGVMESALEHARMRCSAAGRAFYTPDLLLALLEIDGSRAAWAVDEVRPRLAEDLRERLRRYVSALSAADAGPFVPFGWRDRREIQEAQRVAWHAGAHTANEAHVLVGLLATPSKTRDQLALVVDLDALRDAARSASHHEVFLRGTPGSFLDA